MPGSQPAESIRDVAIRLIKPSDSIAELTELLHRAYAALVEQDMRYLASHQDEATTRDRIEKGECYVAALDGGRILGTVVYVGASVPEDTAYYNRPDVAWFQQFAVDPDWQGRGVGTRLMDTIERRAAETGASFIALDTSEHAADLVALYRKRGYKIVAEENWDCTNYRSVIMSKAVG